MKYKKRKSYQVDLICCLDKFYNKILQIHRIFCSVLSLALARATEALRHIAGQDPSPIAMTNLLVHIKLEDLYMDHPANQSPITNLIG